MTGTAAGEIHPRLKQPRAPERLLWWPRALHTHLAAAVAAGHRAALCRGGAVVVLRIAVLGRLLGDIVAALARLTLVPPCRRIGAAAGAAGDRAPVNGEPIVAIVLRAVFVRLLGHPVAVLTRFAFP